MFDVHAAGPGLCLFIGLLLPLAAVVVLDVSVLAEGLCEIGPQCQLGVSHWTPVDFALYEISLGPQCERFQTFLRGVRVVPLHFLKETLPHPVVLVPLCLDLGQQLFL